jgi:hypothetical protein
MIPTPVKMLATINRGMEANEGTECSAIFSRARHVLPFQTSFFSIAF